MKFVDFFLEMKLQLHIFELYCLLPLPCSTSTTTCKDLGGPYNQQRK